MSGYFDFFFRGTDVVCFAVRLYYRVCLWFCDCYSRCFLTFDVGMVRLTPSERAKVVLWYGECHRTKEVRRRFRTEFRRRPPSSPAILRWVRRFEENGNVRDKERTRLSPSHQVFLRNAILGAFAADRTCQREGRPCFSTFLDALFTGS